MLKSHAAIECREERNTSDEGVIRQNLTDGFPPLLPGRWSKTHGSASGNRRSLFDLNIMI